MGNAGGVIPLELDRLDDCSGLCTEGTDNPELDTGDFNFAGVDNRSDLNTYPIDFSLASCLLSTLKSRAISAVSGLVLPREEVLESLLGLLESLLRDLGVLRPVLEDREPEGEGKGTERTGDLRLGVGTLDGVL